MASHARSYLSVPTTCNYVMQKQGYLIQCPHHLKIARVSVSTRARANSSARVRARAGVCASAWELGLITRVLHPYCLRVHKFKNILAS